MWYSDRNHIATTDDSQQGFTYPRHLDAQPTIFCTVAPNIYSIIIAVFSLHKNRSHAPSRKHKIIAGFTSHSRTVAPLYGTCCMAHTLLRWFLDSQKICKPMTHRDLITSPVSNVETSEWVSEWLTHWVNEWVVWNICNPKGSDRQLWAFKITALYNKTSSFYDVQTAVLIPKNNVLTTVYTTECNYM